MREFQITERQTEILAKVASGRGYQEAGKELFLSRHTISSHMQEICSRMGARSSTQAVAWAVATGRLVLCENGEFTAV